MKIKIKMLTTGLLTFLLMASSVFAAGIPEPGLVMYGGVRNTAAGNARLITGTLTWTITPASGSPVTVTTPLTDISGQFSHLVGADVKRLHSISDLRFAIADLKHDPRHLGCYGEEVSTHERHSYHNLFTNCFEGRIPNVRGEIYSGFQVQPLD